MTLEERIAAFENEGQIQQLLVRYCELVDSGRAYLISTEFYAKDIKADYHFNILNGQDEIHNFYVTGMAGFSETAHCVSNVIIHSCDANRAEVTSLITAFHWHGGKRSAEADTPADFGLIVRSEDRLTRTAEGWRVAERQARALGPAFALEPTPLVLRRKA